MVVILRALVFLLGLCLRPFRRRWQPGMAIRCLVVGYGGANNTGSEARSSQAIEQMLRVDPRITITLTSLDRMQTLRYLEESERLRVAQIHPLFLIDVAKLVCGSDAVLLVEGSCFKENFSSALLWFFLYATDLAQKLGLPTVAYGVDAGVLSPANRRWTRDVASRMSLIMMRTQAAARLLHAIGVEGDVHVTTDTAFTMRPERREWAESTLTASGFDLKRPIIGIAFEELFWWPVAPSLWRALRGVKENRYASIYYHTWGESGREKSARMVEEVARFADWAASEYDAQILIIAMERLDIEPCKKLQSRIKPRTVLIDSDHANAKEITSVLRRLDLLLTCRYHAFLLSMGGAVPTIGLAHDERIASIMDELGFIDEALISHEEERIFDLLREKTLIVRKESQRFRRAIERAMPSYLERMAENGRLFGKLIAERFPPLLKVHL